MTPIPPPPPPVRARKTKTRPRGLRRSRTASRSPRAARPRKQSPRSGHLAKPIRRELSAGGVVVRQERGGWVVALLKTEHKRGPVWVLPKGHVEMEKNERVSEAARREVEEETGLKDLAVKDQLGVARFSFQAEGVLVRKTVHYYLMVTQQKTLYPQEEEFFLDAAWFPVDVAIRTLEYDTDQKVVIRARQKLSGGSRPYHNAAPAGSVRVHA